MRYDRYIKVSFISRIVAAMEGMETGGFFKSVIIAQAALESNWGRSTLSVRHNNYFGIKAGKSWKGKSVNMRTGEVLDGKMVVISSNFRVYDSISESIVDRNRLLRTSRYKKVESAATPLDQVRAIKDCGYCTSQRYVEIIMKIIEGNNLQQYDTDNGSTNPRSLGRGASSL